MAIEQEETVETSAFNRRRGDRRASELPPELPEPRRANDRRRRKPGFLALFGILSAPGDER